MAQDTILDIANSRNQAPSTALANDARYFSSLRKDAPMDIPANATMDAAPTVTSYHTAYEVGVRQMPASSSNDQSIQERENLCVPKLMDQIMVQYGYNVGLTMTAAVAIAKDTGNLVEVGQQDRLWNNQ